MVETTSNKVRDENNNGEERNKMLNYWNKHSADCSIQEMMLDTNAETISDQELPEILSVLPDYTGYNILELGAGIGRFTNVIAKKAKKVIAVDFIEKFIEKNRKENSHLGNIEFGCADATKMNYNDNQFNMIFTNWLLMYFTDSEIESLVEKSLNYLEETGYFFIRESCFHASGNLKNLKNVKTDNPTKYRSPSEYISLFLSKSIERNGSQYGFELVFARPNRTYINMKSNSNQVCFLFQKVKLENYQGYKTLQEFFDDKQYTKESILQYEKIYGETHICPGGAESTELFFGNLNLKPGQRVLDLGCGIGGAANYISQKYDVEVYGVDLSMNMIVIAWDRLQKLKETKDPKVRFEIGDITKHDYPNEYFDYIYSRDVLLHVSNKKELLNKMKNWLKPNGQIFITDYACKSQPWSGSFSEYVKGRGYTLLPVSEYKCLFESVGLNKVEGKDETDLFVKYLKDEAEKFAKPEVKEDFLKTFTQENYDYIVESWRVKLDRSLTGDQRWGTFSAQK